MMRNVNYTQKAGRIGEADMSECYSFAVMSYLYRIQAKNNYVFYTIDNFAW